MENSMDPSSMEVLKKDSDGTMKYVDSSEAAKNRYIETRISQLRDQLGMNSQCDEKTCMDVKENRSDETIRLETLVSNFKLSVPSGSTLKSIGQINHNGKGTRQGSYEKPHELSSGISNHPYEAMGMNNHHSGVNQEARNLLVRGEEVPSFVQPQDKDKFLQLRSQYEKFKRNEITKEEFVKVMRAIVGEQGLEATVSKWWKQQVASAMQTSNVHVGEESSDSETDDSETQSSLSSASTTSQMDCSIPDGYEWIEWEKYAPLEEELERMGRINASMEVDLAKCKAERDLLVDENLALKQELENVKLESEKHFNICSSELRRQHISSLFREKQQRLLLFNKKEQGR